MTQQQPHEIVWTLTNAGVAAAAQGPPDVDGRLSRMMSLPVFAATFAQLEYSIRTGSPAVETVDSRGLWAYHQDHPEEAQIFLGRP